MPPQTCAGVTETEVKRPNTSDLTVDEIQSGLLILWIRVGKIHFNFELKYCELFNYFKV